MNNTFFFVFWLLILVLLLKNWISDLWFYRRNGWDFSEDNGTDWGAGKQMRLCQTPPSLGAEVANSRRRGSHESNCKKEIRYLKNRPARASKRAINSGCRKS
jgi:hypothetical protein